MPEKLQNPLNTIIFGGITVRNVIESRRCGKWEKVKSGVEIGRHSTKIPIFAG